MSEFVKSTPISLKESPFFSEKWLQNHIVEDPSLLGLGELDVIRIEKIHTGAGRLDLLLQDDEDDIRYEVELQLGQTDPSHIIRTIEYWDIERRRYPQYNHVAVIVAEEITSRFFNVISLFNRAIPIIAVQVQAIELLGVTTLVFTKILDLTELGTEDEDIVEEPKDRSYWEKKATPETLRIADDFLKLIRSDVEPSASLKYNKHYIGLEMHGTVTNFISFRPRKHHLAVEFGMPNSEELVTELEEAGVSVLPYQARWRRFRIQISASTLAANEDLLRRMIKISRDSFGAPK
jgi:hypothetical protein